MTIFCAAMYSLSSAVRALAVYMGGCSVGASAFGNNSLTFRRISTAMRIADIHHDGILCKDVDTTALFSGVVARIHIRKYLDDALANQIATCSPRDF